MRNVSVFLFCMGALICASPSWAQRIDQLPAARAASARAAASAPAPTTKSVLQAPASAVAAAPSTLAAPSPTLSAATPDLMNGIAIIVNETPISMADVHNRINLAVLSAGLPNTPEVRQNISVQAVRALINEELQLQEATKLGMDVSEKDVDDSMKRIAEDNKIPGGNMSVFLQRNGIPPVTLRHQIKATLAWNKYIMRALKPRVEIGEDEIDESVSRMRATAGRQEYLISEIYLPVDKPDEDGQVKALADKLTGQLKQGSVFGAIARQFSQSPGANAGGDMGWIQAGQLEPEVDKVLQTLQAGEIAGPIRTASGYTILGVREKRTVAMGDPKEIKVSLQQAFHAYTAVDDKDSLLKQANQIRQEITSCDGLSAHLPQRYPGWRVQDLGEVKLAEAPSWLAHTVENIAEGRASEAMATPKGALMLFVCKRSMPLNIDRNAIRNAIGTERLELLARRQIRDLRRDAFVDVRLKVVP